jgi:hypothetical protein
VIGYPTNQLPAVLTDATAEGQVRQELIDAGISPGSIRLLKGDQGVRDLDPGGRGNGLFGRLYRWIQFMAMDATPNFERYEHEVQTGRVVIALGAADPVLRAKADEILRSRNASFVNWYGRLQTALLIP